MNTQTQDIKAMTAHRSHIKHTAKTLLLAGLLTTQTLPAAAQSAEPLAQQIRAAVERRFDVVSTIGQVTRQGRGVGFETVRVFSSTPTDTWEGRFERLDVTPSNGGLSVRFSENAEWIWGHGTERVEARVRLENATVTVTGMLRGDQNATVAIAADRATVQFREGEWGTLELNGLRWNSTEEGQGIGVTRLSWDSLNMRNINARLWGGNAEQTFHLSTGSFEQNTQTAQGGFTENLPWMSAIGIGMTWGSQMDVSNVQIRGSLSGEDRWQWQSEVNRLEGQITADGLRGGIETQGGQWRGTGQSGAIVADLDRMTSRLGFPLFRQETQVTSPEWTLETTGRVSHNGTTERFSTNMSVSVPGSMILDIHQRLADNPRDRGRSRWRTPAEAYLPTGLVGVAEIGVGTGLLTLSTNMTPTPPQQTGHLFTGFEGPIVLSANATASITALIAHWFGEESRDTLNALENLMGPEAATQGGVLPLRWGTQGLTIDDTPNR